MVRQKKKEAASKPYSMTGDRAVRTKLLHTASPTVLENGKALLDAPAMMKRYVHGNQLNATFVYPDVTYVCRVNVFQFALEETCTCEANYFCQHAAALVLTWLEHPATFLNLDEWLQGLDEAPKAELVDMIRRLVARYPASTLEALGQKGFRPEEVLDIPEEDLLFEPDFALEREHWGEEEWDGDDDFDDDDDPGGHTRNGSPSLN